MGTDESKHAESTAGHSWKPVLGLVDASSEPLTIPAPRGTVFDQPEPEPLIELTVIVPARNEEDCLGACLKSLAAQSEEGFQLGRDWELIVVDDHSTDRTAEIAREFPRRHGAAGGQARERLDGQGERDLDRRPQGARPLASVYRCRHRSMSQAICDERSMRPRGIRQAC